MNPPTLRLLAASLALVSAPALARGHGGGGGGNSGSGGGHAYSGSSHYSTAPVHATRSTTTRSSPTTTHTKRDPAQRRAFEHTHACPSTGRTSGACPGYVVDHVQALKRSGTDVPSNMQWQTVQDAKAKDRVE